MKGEQIKVRTITINAIVRGERVIPIDRQGKAICRKRAIVDIQGPIDQGAVLRLRWDAAIVRMKTRLKARADSRVGDPWSTKTSCLASSLRIRRRMERPRPTRKRRFESYSTHTWDEAVNRLREQAHNRLRRARRGGWDRWSHTVSRNHNKKRT